MEKLLIEICNPKQWKTISTQEMKNDGYPVYGANGQIGFYDRYTHEGPTLMITCRGATCGTMNISKPYSYINGNAMALDNLDKENIDLKYLYYYLNKRGFKDTISGSAQPQITRMGLSKVKIYYPTINIQRKIVEILDKSQQLIDKRKAQIEALDELVKSQFIGMFGDPISNPKKWVKLRLKDIVTDDCTISYGIVQTGDEQKEGIPVFRPVDIVKDKKPILSNLKKTTIEISNKYKKTILKGNELLITVRANIGDVFVIDKTFEGCNVGRGITPIRVKETLINIIFFKYQFKSYGCQRELKALAKGITLIQLNMEDLREFSLIVPPIQLQNQFSDFVNQVDKLKVEMQESLKELEENFNSLMQKAFEGQLFENID